MTNQPSKIEPFLTETNTSLYKMSELIIAIKNAIREGNEGELYELLNKINASDCIDLSLEAAKAGQLKLLRVFRRMGFDIHEKVLRAALPHPECLRYAVRHLSERLSYQQMENIMESCAMFQPLESICVLQEAGWGLPRLLCQYAAKGGRLDVLEYAFRNGCLLDTAMKYMYGECMSCIVPCITSSKASIEDRIECLGYVIQNGCELREEFCEDAVQLEEFHILRYLRENPYRACPWKPEELAPLAKGVIKEYIEFCLYQLPPEIVKSSGFGVYCGERGYECGKSGCHNCSMVMRERSMSI
jgi:hypothetical protein